MQSALIDLDESGFSGTVQFLMRDEEDSAKVAEWIESEDGPDCDGYQQTVLEGGDRVLLTVRF